MPKRKHISNIHITHTKRCIYRHQTLPRYHNTTPCIVMWPITAKRDVIHKPEVHNISQRRQRRSHRHGGSAQRISWISVQRFQRYACRQTHRQTDWNTLLPYLVGVIKTNISHKRLKITNHQIQMYTVLENTFDNFCLIVFSDLL